MPSRAILFAASAFTGAALVAAQAAPNWSYIPKACSSDCSQTIESAYLCQTQFSNSTTDIYGCFCNDYPSDASTCATCLNNNDASALGQLLTSTQTACPQAEKSCFFECSIDQCPQSDIACQCSADYLLKIYNCASCNSANGNNDATTLKNFNDLQESCQNQNYTGATQSFTTKALPVATTDGYEQPTLTATGGGEAATGNASGALAAGGDSTAAGTDATASTSRASATGAAASGASAARSSAASGASGARASGASAASGAAGSASSAAPSGGALGLSAPAAGGIIGLVGAIAALI